MKYNTELSKIIIPEYGRHIHQIIEKLSTIKDKKKRNEQAEIVIQIMGNLNPHLRDVNDFKHKFTFKCHLTLYGKNRFQYVC